MKKILVLIAVFAILVSMLLAIVSIVKTQASEWSEPQQLTTDPAFDHYASIMQDSSGKIWLVWFRDGKEILYKISSDEGTSWSSPEVLVPDISKAGGTSLLQDSTGRIWIAWGSVQQSSVGADIFYITSDDGGLSWSAHQQLTNYLGDDNIPSLIEVSGEVWVVFRSYGLSSNEDIWYKKTVDGGVTWSDPISLTSHPAREFTPDAMVDSTGKIWVAWCRELASGNENIYYKTSIDNGISWSSDQELTTHPNDEGHPTIIGDASGKIFIFYTSYGATADIWYNTTEDGGETWSDYHELTVDSYSNGVPYAALISNEVWVILQSNRAGNYDIWMSKITPAVTATVNIDPNTLNLKSNGQWITAYITLPEGYNVKDIVAEIVKIDDIPLVWSEIQDSVFMAKFDRAAVQGLTNEPDYEEEETKFYELTLTVRGELVDGTPFEGTDTIRVIMK